MVVATTDATDPTNDSSVCVDQEALKDVVTLKFKGARVGKRYVLGLPIDFAVDKEQAEHVVVVNCCCSALPGCNCSQAGRVISRLDTVYNFSRVVVVDAVTQLTRELKEVKYSKRMPELLMSFKSEEGELDTYNKEGIVLRRGCSIGGRRSSRC